MINHGLAVAFVFFCLCKKEATAQPWLNIKKASASIRLDVHEHFRNAQR